MAAWVEGLTATHFWDCNGAACDATTLSPYRASLYSFAPQYAPSKPPVGANPYNESLWLVGAMSDPLSLVLGSGDAGCGRDDSGLGGCGRCLLVRNQASSQPDLLAVVMKKSRCPAETNLCGGNNTLHVDVAVPGFDYLSESIANVCGNPTRLATFITKNESQACTMTDADSASDNTSSDCSWTGADRQNCGSSDGSV